MTFEKIPSTLKNPLFYVEVGDPIGAGEDVKTSVIIGQRITGQGTGTNDTPIQIFSADDAAAAAGLGSIAHRLALHYFEEDKGSQEVILVPIADAGGGAKAAKTFTFSFSGGTTLTASGTIAFLVAGEKVRVNVMAGSDIAAVGAAIQAAFGADEAGAVAIGSRVPVTCAATGGACTFTARNAGVLGNDIRIVINYFGTPGGEVMPGNLVCDTYDEFLASGSGIPDITAALLALSPYAIFGLIEPHYTADELLEKLNEFADRWDWDISTFGGHFFGVVKKTLTEIVGVAAVDDNLKNDLHACGVAAARVPFDSVALCAAYAGACISSLRNDPSLPVQSVRLSSLYPVRKADRLTINELESLTAAGFATIAFDSTGVPVVSLERTTMLKNALGAPITGGEAIQVPYTTQYLIESMRTYCRTAYARVKLVDDGARTDEGVAVVTPLEIKSDVGSLADDWEGAGLIESAEQFKSALIVERDSVNKNRVNIGVEPDLANQLRVIAVRAVPRV